MNNWTVWILSVIIVCIISALLQLFLHGGKTESTVKKGIGIVLTFMIISPLPAILGNLRNFDEVFNSNYEFDVGFVDYTNTYIVKCIEKNLEQEIDNIGIHGATVMLDAEYIDGELSVKNIIINLDKSVIDEKFEHINKYTAIRNAVKNNFDISEEKIVIYE